jgi:hypothetical protein
VWIINWMWRCIVIFLAWQKEHFEQSAYTINFIPINYFGKKRQGTVTFYISHKKLKNTARRVLSARLSNVSEMRYFSTHTIHTWASPLLRAPRTLNIYTLYHYYLFFICNIWYTRSEKRIRAGIHRARHTGTFYKNCGSAFNSKLHCLVFLFLLLFGNKNSFIVARGESERAGSLRAQRHPRPIQECLHCVLMHAEEHSSAFIKVKCSVTYSKRSREFIYGLLIFGRSFLYCKLKGSLAGALNPLWRIDALLAKLQGVDSW